jgi:hypothetical protein
MESQSYRRQDKSNQKEGSAPEMSGPPKDSQQDVKKRGKERVQFDFSSDALYRLDQLKIRLDAGTRAEVIRLALRLLEFFATEVPEEATITVTIEEEKLLAKFKAKLLYGYGSKE